MNERILIVEDDAIVAMDLQMRLEKLGYAVAGHVSNGRDAVAQAFELNPDLILMDIKIRKEMDGIQAAAQIRARQDMAVVYVTAFSDDITLKRACETEPFGYLIKPFDDRELYSTVEIALYKHRMEKKLRENEEWHRKELEKRVATRTAALAAANQELEEFSYSVAHDLKTPLRGVMGFSQILMEEYGHLLDAQGQDYLLRIQNASSTMFDLLEDLLNLARIARMQLNCAAVDLAAVARGLAAQLRDAYPERRVEWVIPRHLPVQGDPSLLKIMIDHLLDNAWKFSSKTQQTRIELGSFVRNEETIYFLQDNGVGFDMQYAGKLFGTFQNLHISHELEGNGIGLAIVQRIVQRHGGRVWAESEPDKGAIFYFTLP